jgi:hypothetical protein
MGLSLEWEWIPGTGEAFFDGSAEEALARTTFCATPAHCAVNHEARV